MGQTLRVDGAGREPKKGVPFSSLTPFSSPRELQWIAAPYNPALQPHSNFDPLSPIAPGNVVFGTIAGFARHLHSDRDRLSQNEYIEKADNDYENMNVWGWAYMEGGDSGNLIFFETIRDFYADPNRLPHTKHRPKN